LVFVDEIPRNASGKPRRSALTEQYRTALRQPQSSGESLTEQEQHTADRLLDIWSRTLGKPVTSIDHDFGQLGGDSLSAARMLSDVDAAFHANGQIIKRGDFFDQPTVRTLLRIVAECRPSAASATNGILTLDGPAASNAAPVFFFPGWRGRQGGPVDPYYLRHLAAHIGDNFHIVTASIPHPELARPVEELARESITAIRSMQPRGPYLLAGHCLGAVVAFDVARQLIAAGDQVTRILLYDAVTPGYPKMALSPSKVATEIFRVVRHLDWREGWSHVDSFARLLHQRFAGRSNRSTETKLNNFRGIALWQYQPAPCQIPMVHFIAADHPVSRVVDDPRYGWREFAQAGIEFQPVPGDHDSMFHKEHAAALAQRLLNR
jgi:thioesterase domain-containing protein